MAQPPPDFMPLDPGRTTRGSRWPIQPLPAMVCRAPRKPAVRATPLDREMPR
ncbi:MAG: hypothetical protein MUP33_11485 [Polaromonas sp.]|nr:hypothetical protein [Polaromonas sp.]